MGNIIILLLIVFLSGLCSSCTKKSIKPPEIPLEDFFRNPEKSLFQISPDGNHLAYMASYKDMKNVFISDLNNDNIVQLTFETERSVYSYGWKNPNTIIFIKDVGGDENMQIFSVNIDNKEVKSVVAIEKVRAEIVDWLKDFPDEMIISSNQRNPQV